MRTVNPVSGAFSFALDRFAAGMQNQPVYSTASFVPCILKLWVKEW